MLNLTLFLPTTPRLGLGKAALFLHNLVWGGGGGGGKGKVKIDAIF